MAGSSRRCGRIYALKSVVPLAACALMVTSCASDSYQEAAMKAFDEGDKKGAISLAKEEVERFARPDQCSRATNLNCGTLALAYGTLAGYQILDGDRRAGEESFIGAKGALSLTDVATRPSATAMVYRDVSDALWKVGDRTRAVAVFNEGVAAGADKWLFMSSAARAADQKAADQKAADQRAADQKAADQQPAGQPSTGSR
jgi:hypothetical protein